jgi:hypothetical protein
VPFKHGYGTTTVSFESLRFPFSIVKRARVPEELLLKTLSEVRNFVPN